MEVGRALFQMLAELRLKSLSERGRTLLEVTLKEAVRYKPGDRLEALLSDLLCLDCEDSATLLSEPPPPKVISPFFPSFESPAVQGKWNP